MGCLAIFLLREALHEIELSSTFRNGLQQLTTPLHSVSLLQQLASQFYGNFNKGACAQFLFFVQRSIVRQVAEKIVQCNRASAPNLGNLQRLIFSHCETSCWRIAQCSRAFNSTKRIYASGCFVRMENINCTPNTNKYVWESFMDIRGWNPQNIF